jgi:hypothetical protein
MTKEDAIHNFTQQLNFSKKFKVDYWTILDGHHCMYVQCNAPKNKRIDFHKPEGWEIKTVSLSTPVTIIFKQLIKATI